MACTRMTLLEKVGGATLEIFFSANVPSGHRSGNNSVTKDVSVYGNSAFLYVTWHYIEIFFSLHAPLRERVKYAAFVAIFFSLWRNWIFLYNAFSLKQNFLTRECFQDVLLLCHFVAILRGCPCKNRPLDFRPKTEFLQIFRVRQLVHVINKNGNNLASNAIFQYFWRQFQRTVQNRLNRSVSSQIKALR